MNTMEPIRNLKYLGLTLDKEKNMRGITKIRPAAENIDATLLQQTYLDNN